MGIIRQSTSKLFFLIYSPIYFCIMFSVVGLYFVMSYLCHRNDSNSEHKYASIFDLDRYFTTTFGDEFWERHQSVMSVLTHVNLQSWNIHIHSGDCKILKYDDIEKTGVQVGLKANCSISDHISALGSSETKIQQQVLCRYRKRDGRWTERFIMLKMHGVSKS